MNETIGNRIAKFRKAKAMTQEDLANQLGVSSQAVSKWENDASCPDISLLPQLCKVLGVTTDELLTGKNDEVKLVPVDQRKSLDALTLRIKVDSAQGDKVRVNLPMSLVKVGLEMGMDISGSVSGMENLKNVDLNKILELAEKGLIGKLVEVESADGDTVEIVVE
ncbi:MAG: helix-turn-helix transcriptional regulator [Ruminococcaceae bacterium]|nr:helix-turn-helix transcriptional regulator [Oscillospiraceae bacterium]